MYIYTHTQNITKHNFRCYFQTECGQVCIIVNQLVQHLEWNIKFSHKVIKLVQAIALLKIRKFLSLVLMSNKYKTF